MDGGRRHRAPEQGGEELKSLSPEALSALFVGTWNDQRQRWWFTIDRIEGNEIPSAQFRLAHLKSGRVDGGRLALVSQSCIPVLGCYDYRIRGTLISRTRMDMYATDDAGETVHFVLVRQ